MTLPADQRDACLNVLQQVADDPSLIATDERFKALVAKIHRGGNGGHRQAQEAQARETGRTQLSPAEVSAGQLPPAPRPELASIESIPASPAPLPPPAVLAPIAGEGAPPRDLVKPRTCYVCREPFTQVHWFYHGLCPDCAAFNWKKRVQRGDLRGRTVLLTGGRGEIGREVALKLLRDGVRVLLTTRFPANVLRRFSAEEDFATWGHRLELFVVDLRDLPQVEEFCHHLLRHEPYLDAIIHGATQIMRRPPAFYEPILALEEEQYVPLPARQIIVHRFTGVAQSSSGLLQGYLPEEGAPGGPQGQLPPAQHGLPGQGAAVAASGLAPNWGGASPYPPVQLDPQGLQEDAGAENSWMLKLHQVPAVEVLEVQLVNAIAPFVINSNLMGLLTASPHDRRFIVNRSTLEGQFGRGSNAAYQPHTKMAQAAINMMTRTCAAGLAADGVYMTVVDTGLITNENPMRKPERMEDAGLYASLDSIDAAARICDPLYSGLSSAATPQFGVYLKDYWPHEW